MHKETFEFANEIIDWHAKKINHLKGLLEAVGKVESAELEGPEGKVEMTGPALDAFILGLGIAITELEELPFELVRKGDPDGTKPH